MKQKVSVAISLVHQPDIIVFDEPTNGLDVYTAKIVTDYLLELKKQGKSIIISTHIMSLVEKLCDRVGLIFNGKMVICDTLDKVLDSVPSRDLEEVFIKLYQEEGAQ
jgi:sodium transport system ATP-binding protein